MKKKIVSLLCIIALFSTTLTGAFGATYAEAEPPVKEVTISETLSAEISLRNLIRSKNADEVHLFG